MFTVDLTLEAGVRRQTAVVCHSCVDAPCVDAPLDARGFSSDSGNVVRRFRVSGLIVRQFTRRGPVWKSEDRVQIGVARSKRSE